MKKKSGRKKGHRSKEKKRRPQHMASESRAEFSDEIALKNARALVRNGSPRKAWDYLLRSLDKLSYEPGDLFHVKLMLRVGLFQDVAEWMINPACRIAPEDRNRIIADALPLLEQEAIDSLDPSGKLRNELPVVRDLLKLFVPDQYPEVQRRAQAIPIRSPYRHWRVFLTAQAMFIGGRYAEACTEFSKIPEWSLLFEPAIIFLAAAGVRMANSSGIIRLKKVENAIESGAFGEGIRKLLIIEQTEAFLKHTAPDLALIHIAKLQSSPFVKSQMPRMVRLAFAKYHIREDDGANREKQRLLLRSAGLIMKAAMFPIVCNPAVINEDPDAMVRFKDALLKDLGWMTDPRKKGHRAVLQRIWVEALLTLLEEWKSNNDAHLMEMLEHQLNLLDQWAPDDPANGLMRLKYIKVTDPAAAARQIDTMLKSDPGNVALMLEAADAAAKRRSFTIALKWIDRAIGLAPTDRTLQSKKVDILLKSSVKHLRAGMPEAAMKELDDAEHYAVTPDNRWHIVLAKFDTALFGKLTLAQSDQPDAVVNSLFIEDLINLAQAFETFSFISSKNDIRPLERSIIERFRKMPPLSPSDLILRVKRFFELKTTKSDLLREMLLTQIPSLSENDITNAEDMNRICSLFAQSRNPKFNDLYYRFVSSGIERFHDNIHLYIKYLHICKIMQREIPLRIIAEVRDNPHVLEDPGARWYIPASSVALDMLKHNQKLTRSSNRKPATMKQDESGIIRQGGLFDNGSVSDP